LAKWALEELGCYLLPVDPVLFALMHRFATDVIGFTVAITAIW